MTFGHRSHWFTPAPVAPAPAAHHPHQHLKLSAVELRVFPLRPSHLSLSILQVSSYLPVLPVTNCCCPSSPPVPPPNSCFSAQTLPRCHALSGLFTINLLNLLPLPVLSFCLSLL